jgi:hypothetical protein
MKGGSDAMASKRAFDDGGEKRFRRVATSLCGLELELTGRSTRYLSRTQ